jgi:hypothetical protein
MNRSLSYLQYLTLKHGGENSKFSFLDFPRSKFKVVFGIPDWASLSCVLSGLQACVTEFEPTHKVHFSPTTTTYVGSENKASHPLLFGSPKSIEPLLCLHIPIRITGKKDEGQKNFLPRRAAWLLPLFRSKQTLWSRSQIRHGSIYFTACIGSNTTSIRFIWNRCHRLHHCPRRYSRVYKWQLITVQDGQIDSYFSYFTHITYISLTIYLLFAAGHTIWYARTGVSPINRWYRPFQLAHTVLYTTIITFPFLVTIVFWALLSSSSTFATTQSRFSNISQHALNSAFALFEVLFCAVGNQPWSHVIFIIIFLGIYTPSKPSWFLATYLGVAYITHATQGIYVYSFLNPSKGAILAAYICGIFAGTLVIFALVNLVKWALKRTTHAKELDRWRERYEMRTRDVEHGKDRF